MMFPNKFHKTEWDYERAALLSEIKSLQKRLRLCGKDNIELRKKLTHEHTRKTQKAS